MIQKVGNFIKKRNVLLLLLLIVAFVSVNQWSRIPIGNTTMIWLISLGVLYLWYQEMRIQKISFFQKPYAIVGVYLIWAVIGIVRGALVQENYWEMKALIGTSFAILFPLCVYAFSSPILVGRVLGTWVKYALPAFVLWFYWVVGITQFYLAPIYLLLCFLPIIQNGWKRWAILVAGILLLTANIEDARSQFLKAVCSFAVMGGCYFRKYLTDKMLRFVHWAFYIIPVILLYLGIMGVFNIFEDVTTKYGGQYVAQTKEGESIDMASDTRTFIYQEVITSAIKNDYVLLGRTPARGNDTFFFSQIKDELQSLSHERNLKYERSSNEVCFPNIFTWLGLVGMLLYIGIYGVASFLAVYRSRNVFIKLVGVYVAFNFMYGWIENCTRFDILNIVIWLMISMSLSERFRKMKNIEFIVWIRHALK